MGESGASAPAMGGAAIVWLILMQIIAWSMGGYLAGRLRTKWTAIHTDEVYFRDTAHGFLVWSVGTVLTAAFLASAAAAMIGGVARGGASAAGTTAGISTAEGPGRTTDPSTYFIDSLLRTPPSTTTVEPNQVLSPTATVPPSGSAQYAAANSAATRGEVATIFANDLRQGNLPPDDKTYVAQVVAARTGVSESDAEQRVTNTFTQMQQAADAARRAVAHTSLWIFLALLIGAFCASVGGYVRRGAARPGGRALAGKIADARCAAAEASKETDDALHFAVVFGHTHTDHFVDALFSR